MLTLASLSRAELDRRLTRGLRLRTGPFHFRLKSRVPRVAEGLAELYADFPLAEDAGFADFHAEVGREAGLRRFIAPQINFWLDGQSPFKPLPSHQAFALLEWGMNWCIAGRAHHYLMLHAAALERNGACIVMPGEPGAGKSTLTAALMLSGWRLLSDELTLIDRRDGSLAGLARPVSLKNASIDVIRGFDARARIGAATLATHKGTVAHLRPDGASIAAVDRPGRAAHIVFPRWRADAPAARLTRRTKADAFELLARNSFNYSLLGRLGFTLNADLIDACDGWDFTYSRLDEAMRVLEDLVA